MRRKRIPPGGRVFSASGFDPLVIAVVHFRINLIPRCRPPSRQRETIWWWKQSRSRLHRVLRTPTSCPCRGRLSLDPSWG
ncbi:unnamed protein product [Discosporangium mesarthrocarpum]